MCLCIYAYGFMTAVWVYLWCATIRLIHVGRGKCTDNVFLCVFFTADCNAFTASTISPSLELSLRLLQLPPPPPHTHTHTHTHYVLTSPFLIWHSLAKLLFVLYATSTQLYHQFAKSLVTYLCMCTHCVNETVFLWQLFMHVEFPRDWFSVDPPLTAHRYMCM